MLDIAQNAFVFLGTLVASVVFSLLLNWLWPREQRRIHNDLIGWQLNTIGTTYAVILGFMLYTVWTAFGQAQLNVDLEASSLRNIYRMAQGLPEPQRSTLQRQARQYVTTVLDQDWPQMANDQVPEASHMVNQAMWQTLLSVQTATPTQSTAEDHALSEMSSLTEHRRTRLLESAYRLPAIFWVVLISGGVLTFLSVSLFGSKNTTLHIVQVCSYTILTTLVLLAISDVNLPFQGAVHVSNYGFIRAQRDLGNQ